jgi:hypothetical protein
VSTPPEHPNQSEEELRVVVDAQIVLTMFLARRDRSGLVSPKRELLGLLTEPKFRWLWTDLRLLGESYGNVQIVSCVKFRAELARLGLVN